MKKYSRSLQKVLPLYYSLVLFISLTLMFVTFYIYFIKNLRKSEIVNLQNISKSAVTNVSQQIETMSTISLNTIYAKDIIPNIQLLDSPELAADDIYNRTQVIYNSISAIIGPQQTVTQVNLYDINGISIGSGFYSYRRTCSLEQMPWYEGVAAQEGYRYMSAPGYLSDFLTVIPKLSNERYIALSRLYLDKVYRINGVVEVIQNQRIFFQFLGQTLASNKNLSIMILNDRNELIYPLDSEDLDAALSYQSHMTDPSGSGEVITLRDRAGQKQLLVASHIPGVNWTIFVSEPEQVITQALIFPSLLFLVFLISSLVVTLYICFSISRRVLLPIDQLKVVFESIDLNNIFNTEINEIHLPQSNFDEVKTLITSFRNLYTKLHSSTIELIKSKEEEIRAKEIATQSMMKPHFLYNNLANISVMAEANMNQEIIALTENLCDYLRYTSTFSSNNVSIEEEFFYTQKYLRCMGIRYKERLRYQFELAEDMKQIKIPKLSIQPIVENSLKYAFLRKPPWEICIRGYRDKKHWYVEIQDNGTGFEPAALEEVYTRLDNIAKTKDLTKLKIGGMGLQNVYLRLLLIYGDDILFELKNVEGGGAIVRFGGGIESEKNEEL